MRAPALLGAVLLLAGCAAVPPRAPRWVAEPWPAAEAMFLGDRRWLGGDACYSVPLGDDRFLWLFGDSFVATSDRRDRRESVMVRNSIAIQDGADPTAATLRFHWREAAGRPASFFPEQGERLFWPLHGVRLREGPLLLFQSAVRNTPGEGLGFAVDGWRILRIDDGDREPLQWQPQELLPPELPFQAMIGTAVWRDGDFVVALGTGGTAPHDGVLARFAVADLLAGRVQPQWWDGASWGAAPAVVLREAGPECSLFRQSDAGAWLHLYSRGFGATTIAAHTAPAPTGPFDGPWDIVTPVDSLREHAFVYAAKGHAGIDAGPGCLMVTYATNSFTFADLFAERGQRELYWPRVVRLRWR